MAELKIGDTVSWRGCFGRDLAKDAEVREIIITEQPRTKYGESVDSVDWELVKQNRVLVDFTNGFWSYGEQISQKK